MKKKVTFIILSIFLFLGIFFNFASADQLKLVSYSGSTSWRGEYTFATNPPDQFLWGYCTEEFVSANIGTWYTYTLQTLDNYVGPKPNYGWYAADLIWKQYYDGNVTAGEKTTLQFDIWKLWTDTDFYNSYVPLVSIESLNSLFAMAVVGNSQDFIVRKPVPEPISMLLFGTGLAGVGGYVRRKLKKI